MRGALLDVLLVVFDVVAPPLALVPFDGAGVAGAPLDGSLLDGAGADEGATLAESSALCANTGDATANDDANANHDALAALFMTITLSARRNG